MRDVDSLYGKRLLREGIVAKAARKKAGVPPSACHAVAVRQLPLAAEVRALIERWESLAEVSDSSPEGTNQTGG
jgi:hypothetical protein